MYIAKVPSMTDREIALERLVIGDIFHATSSDGTTLICLVTLISDTTIYARTVTTQYSLKFARRTGVGEWRGPTVPCTIDSIAPLPVDIHNVMLGIDRKFRLELKEERFKLTDDEKRALLFVGPHYEANPL